MWIVYFPVSFFINHFLVRLTTCLTSFKLPVGGFCDDGTLVLICFKMLRNNFILLLMWRHGADSASFISLSCGFTVTKRHTKASLVCPHSEQTQVNTSVMARQQCRNTFKPRWLFSTDLSAGFKELSQKERLRPESLLSSTGWKRNWRTDYISISELFLHLHFSFQTPVKQPHLLIIIQNLYH